MFYAARRCFKSIQLLVDRGRWICLQFSPLGIFAITLVAAELQKLMRHANIETTMKFYASETADDLSAPIWENFGLGTNLGTIAENESETTEAENQ